MGTPEVRAAATAPHRFRLLRPVLSHSYLLLGIVGVLIIGSLLSPYFFTANNFENIVVTGAVVSVLAVGQFTVIVTRGIDLSVGSLAAFATVMAAVLMRDGTPWVLSALIGLGVCSLAGLINGLVVVYGRITPFIATLGMLSIAQGVAYLVQSGTQITIENSAFKSFFDGTVAGIPSPVWMFVIVMLIFAVLMRWTTFGRQLYAIGGNPEAARLSGLPVNRNLVIAYSLSGLLAGLAGLMLAAQLGQGNSLLARGYELDAIAAAVVGGASLFGGTGSPVTAVLGGLLIGTITDIMNLRNIAAEPQLIIKGLLILVAVFLTSGAGGDVGRWLRSLFVGRRRDTGGPEGPAPDGTHPSAAGVGVTSTAETTGPVAGGRERQA
jgi:ribose transport system permease protein